MTIKDFCIKNNLYHSDDQVGDVGDLSDGYHTFNDLYEQRCVLFAALCNTFADKAWKSYKHSDGEDCFGGGWFIVGISTPDGQYSYHYENKNWDMFECKEVELAPEWDGHTDKDIKRLLSLNRVEEGSMTEWAKKEVELACVMERADSDVQSPGWDYGCACYESAFKALKSLSSDGHSGFSIMMTKHILNRLIDGKALTPIEDTDDIWRECCREKGLGYTTYQCERMSSLFKDVYIDGTVKYHDVDASYCVDISNDSTYTNGYVRSLIDDLYPITMPYMPGEATKIYCEDFLFDPENGDYDTKGIFYIIRPDGERVEINRFFKEDGRDWTEIDIGEYEKRKVFSARLRTEKASFSMTINNLNMAQQEKLLSEHQPQVASEWDGLSSNTPEVADAET